MLSSKEITFLAALLAGISLATSMLIGLSIIGIALGASKTGFILLLAFPTVMVVVFYWAAILYGDASATRTPIIVTTKDHLIYAWWMSPPGLVFALLILCGKGLNFIYRATWHVVRVLPT